MKKRVIILIFALVSVLLLNTACSRKVDTQNKQNSNAGENMNEKQDIFELTFEVAELENGLCAVQYDGDYGFDDFMTQGGASSDADVVAFLTKRISISGFSFDKIGFGCSTLAVQDETGHFLFGRNFDWNHCNAMIVRSAPENGYASISTVNTDFISGVNFSRLPDEVQAMIALYAPLDGMNEKGFVVSVNMIQDSATISQITEKPDITTTTAIRLLLNQAANVEEALELLQKYDMHASMGYMVHFAMADTDGCSVVAEYVNNKIIVTKTPVVTNFYLAESEKYGIGTEQSHTRYDILTKRLNQTSTMSMEDVRDALSSVSKGNFGEFESTEWSIVYNQSAGEVHYYHRENYDNRYIFNIKEETP